MGDHTGGMSTEPADPLAPDHLRAWGIEPGYQDVFGGWQTPSPEAVARIRRAMGATTDDPAEPPPAGTDLRIVRPAEQAEVPAGSTLVLEDGSEVAAEDGVVPRDVPLGYHRVVADDGGTGSHLIVSPGRTALPAELRTWGITAQLYAARSSRSWGMGDLADLRRLVDWATERGAGIVGLNPLHASDPVDRPADSPYSPSSRRWRDPLYLAVEEVPGATGLADLHAVAAAGRALSDGTRIDRAAVWAAKRSALETIWADFGSDPRFDAYWEEHGPALTTWATHAALVDHHGGPWPDWPTEHRRPDAPGVAAFARDHDGRIGFWAWLQWLLDEQLVASGAPDVAVADLAVGFAADGADAWEWQDLVAPGVRIGAPPDLLGPDGQDWGLPPFVPGRLRDVAYRPLAETIRAVARHARGLRIDHVMGLFRLLWIPPGLGAADGAYVRFPGSELLEVVALESARSGALVVGEDLGTVEPGVRELLADAGVLSTRLLWFEEDPPADWPVQAMAAVTTHDLPTTAGVWSGTDLADQGAAGVTVPADGDADMRHRLRAAAGTDDGAPVDEVVVGAHRRLAEAPSMIVTAALDDLVGAEHRPNLPGTIDEHPNWRIPLPVPVDELAGHPLAEAVAEALGAGRGRPAG